MLKQLIRRWLDIEPPMEQYAEQFGSLWAKANRKADDARITMLERMDAIESMHKNRDVRKPDYQNTLHQIIELNQKFDVLAEALGVVIVADFVGYPPEPTIASIRENGLLGDAQQYINAVMVADKLAGLDYQVRKRQAELLRELGIDGRRRKNAEGEGIRRVSMSLAAESDGGRE